MDKKKNHKSFNKRNSILKSEKRKDYLSANEETSSGRRQGVSFYNREFFEDVYTSKQFKRHEEQMINLPTELIEVIPFSLNARKVVNKLADDKVEVLEYYTNAEGDEKLLTEDEIKIRADAWEKIANRFIKNLGLEDLYGENHVAAHIHFRDKNSGQTKNDNLHIHIPFVDRIAMHDKKLTYDNNLKRPYAFNLGTGTIVKDEAYNNTVVYKKNEDGTKTKIVTPKAKIAPHHFKIEEDTAILNFDLVDKKLMKKIKTLAGSAKKNHTDDELKEIENLKIQILQQAQSQSLGAIKYSKRLEKFEDETNVFGEITYSSKEQYKDKIMLPRKKIICDTLNEIVAEYNLKKTLDKYGEYVSTTKDEDIKMGEEKLELREEELQTKKLELDEKISDIPNQVKKQVDSKSKELDAEKAKSITINVEKQAEVDGLKQDRINLATDNAELLKNLKNEEEKLKKQKEEQEKNDAKLKQKQLEIIKENLIIQNNLIYQYEELFGEEIKLNNEFISEFEDTEYDDYITLNENWSLKKINSKVINDINGIRPLDISSYIVEYFEVIFEQGAKLINNAWTNWMNKAYNIVNDLAEKNKELTTVTNSISTKNNELADVTNTIANKTGELNKMIDKGIDDILAGKRKKLIYGDELDKHIDLLFDDLEKNIPYGNAIVKISDNEFTFKYPEFAKSLAPAMDTLNKALDALKGNRGFEVEYSVNELENVDKYMLEGMVSDFADQVISDTLYGYYCEDIDEGTLSSRIGAISSRIGNNFGGSDTSNRIGVLEKLIKQAANSNKDRNGNIFGPNPWYIDPWDISNDYIK